ncbi:hypothetical protein ACIOZM_08175 [Pseudomonas sp. NPDC087346]
MTDYVASAAKDKNGKPLWMLSKDGRLFLSVATVEKATINQAEIKT